MPVQPMPRSPVEQFEALRFEGATERLERVHPSAVSKLEAKCGALPLDYVNLLTTVGVGALVLPGAAEPVTHRVLAPTDVLKARKDLVGWLGPTAVGTARARQKLDVTKLVPILSAADGTWVLLGGQQAADGRVYVFSHDWEQRPDLDVFAGPLTLGAFFDKYFTLAAKKDPLNGSQAHRVLFSRAAR
jgi:hypothetical protein